MTRGMRFLTLAAVLSAAAPQSAAAQECRERGHLGIESFVCRSGSCLVNVPLAGERVHDFAVEPEVGGIVEGGPADGILRVGDTVVAIDGTLVTTPEGGRRLALLRPTAAVRLQVRREGAVREFLLQPAAGCHRPGLVVYGGVEVPPPIPPTLPAGNPAAPRASFDVTLRCARCGWVRNSEGALRFHSVGPVRVGVVEAGGAGDRAGLRSGDLILSVAGEPLGSQAAARALGELVPGDSVVLRIRRQDHELDFLVHLSHPQRLPDDTSRSLEME